MEAVLEFQTHLNPSKAFQVNCWYNEKLFKSDSGLERNTVESADSLKSIVGCSSAEDTAPDPNPVHSVLDLLSKYEESSSSLSCKRGSLGRCFVKDRGTDKTPMENTLGIKESINRSISMVS